MIFGHKKQWNYLMKMAKERRIPHALLFVGQEGIGKKKVAFEFAKFLLKKEPISHPDFIFVEPVNNLISIEQIRDLIWKLSLKPISSDFKIAIIDDAHSMGQDSQNCFLKKLEEPENSIIILITPYPNLLFPTILSRCQKIKFYPLSKSEIKNFLIEKKLDEEKAEKIAKICQGKIGKAISFLDSKNYEDFERKVKEFEKILNSPLYLRFNFVKNLLEENDLKKTMEIWFYFLREKLIEFLKRKDLKIKRMIRSISLLEKIYYLIFTKNVSKRLALEILMLEL
jgi:DNA polymerase-3 subunit delta'